MQNHNDLVVSSEPVDPPAQEVAADSDTPALAMGIAVTGGRRVLQDVSPFSDENNHFINKTCSELKFKVCLPPWPEPQHDASGTDAASLQGHSVEGPHVNVDATLLYIFSKLNS